MSFRPQAEQSFLLVPKFIDPKDKIVLGVNGTEIGAHLQLQTLDSTNPNQQFKFRAVNDFFCIEHGGNSIVVPEKALENGIPITQWHPSKADFFKRSPNINFQLVPAGNGYYRIRAAHSGKFMDVLAFKKTPGSNVVQHQLTIGENQLFKLVPVPEQRLAASPVSFSQTNEMIRSGILAVVGMTPKVGAGLKFIAGIFWTEHDKLGDFWNQMKSYVDERVMALIKKDRLNEMTDLLNGYMKLLKEISESPNLQGQSLLDAVIYPIVVKQENLIKKSVELLPYIVGFGCIMISLRRSMVLAQDYKALFGVDIDEETLVYNKRLLQETIDLYTNAVNDCVAEAKKWRMSFLDSQSRKEEYNRKSGTWTQHYYSVKDNYDGWGLDWKSRTGEAPYGPLDIVARGDFAVEQRHKQVEVQFDSEMQDFVKQSKLWKNFNPDVGPYVESVVRKEVGIFGGKNAMNHFNSDGVKRITDIYIHYWDGDELCGFEIYQDDVTMGIQGRRGNKVAHLKLDDGENINSVFGYGQDSITGLWFSTHRGKYVGGGSTNGGVGYFSGDISDNFNAKLVKISGANDEGSLQQISFTWEYVN